MSPGTEGVRPENMGVRPETDDFVPKQRGVGPESLFTLPFTPPKPRFTPPENQIYHQNPGHPLFGGTLHRPGGTILYF